MFTTTFKNNAGNEESEKTKRLVDIARKMNAGTKSWDELSPRVQNCVLRDFGALDSYFNDNPIIDSTLDYEEIYDLIFIRFAGL